MQAHILSTINVICIVAISWDLNIHIPCTGLQQSSQACGGVLQGRWPSQEL